MGTNYYAFTGNKVEVECDCGFKHLMDEKLHIGKNSFGWMFSLHTIPEKGIFELEDWLPILKKSKIVDEYGDEITYDDMLKTILKTEKRKISKESQWRLADEASKLGYHLDTEHWLLYMDKKGKMGNYALVSGDFS